MVWTKSEDYPQETTYGNFPSAREIRVSRRREELEIERESLDRFWKNLHRENTPQSPDRRERIIKMLDRSKTSVVENEDATRRSSRVGSSSSQQKPRSTRTTSDFSDDLISQHQPNFSFCKSRPDSSIASATPRSARSSATRRSSPDGATCPRPVNVNTHFQPSEQIRPRHCFVSPEWISEALCVRRLEAKKAPNPLKYGWI